MTTQIFKQAATMFIVVLFLAGCGSSEQQEPVEPVVEEPVVVEQVTGVAEQSAVVVEQAADASAPGDEPFENAFAAAQEIADIVISDTSKTDMVVERDPGVSLTVTEIRQAKAVIESIDMDARTVIVMTENGQKKNFTAGSSVRHLDKLAPGNEVIVSAVEALAVYLDKQAESDAVAADAILRPEDDTPGGMVVSAALISTRVVALDKDTRQCELEMPDGEIIPIKVRESIDLSQVNVGDTLIAEILRTIVIEVKQ